MRHIYMYAGELFFAAFGIMFSFAPHRVRKFIIWMNQDPWSKEQVRDNQIMKKVLLCGYV
jgi:hypothetical protein